MMAKTFLFACPHAFIVSERNPFLEKNGDAPKKLESLIEVLAASSGASLYPVYCDDTYAEQ